MCCGEGKCRFSGHHVGGEEPNGGEYATHDGDDFEAAVVFGGSVHGVEGVDVSFWNCGNIITVMAICNLFLRKSAEFIIPAHGRRWQCREFQGNLADLGSINEKMIEPQGGW